MACPALPTCGLAITEAERVFDQVLGAIEKRWANLGLSKQSLQVRMTGCPNNCARSFMAEIGFVGRSLNSYNIYVGGRDNGTRLNYLYAENVKQDQLLARLDPVLQQFAREHQPNETFGDFCQRMTVLEMGG
jgi:sulfite reductase (ferredoxin)